MDASRQWACITQLNGASAHDKIFHKFYERYTTVRGEARIGEQGLRKHILGAKKTERIIFAATPGLKGGALEAIAQEKCVSPSALITSLAADEVIENKELFDGKK